MPSEIRVDTINNRSGLGTITVSNTGAVFAGVTTFTSASVGSGGINGGQVGGSRNIIINGSMVVNQRGFTGAAGTSTTGSYTTDRFKITHSHDGAVSAGQTTLTSGNAYADGFQNALIFRVTTADSSLAASQYQLLQQRIEGYNVQGIKKGTANAQPITLSFWVRATTTGTYIIDLGDDDNNRNVSQAYTINSANTWEKKTLTFPADTTGVFNNDNDAALDIIWWLAAGSDYSGGTLQTTWGARVNANRAVGQTNLLATAGNDFFLTGVQLEVGSQATPFEWRSYGQELSLCQRYYWKDTGITVQAIARATVYDGMAQVFFPVPMRSTPTATALSGGSTFARDISGGPTAGPSTGAVTSTWSTHVEYSLQASGGSATGIIGYASGTGTASAEL